MARTGRGRSPSQLCPERSAGLRDGRFVASRGMGFRPGEESGRRAVAAKAIEAQPSSG